MVNERKSVKVVMDFNQPNQELLTKKAWGDFVHDFDDPVRANVTVGILNQIPIEATQSVKRVYQQLLEWIARSNNGKQNATAFQLFRSLFVNTVPPGAEPFIPTAPLHENDITSLANIPYADIMKGLKTAAPGVVPIPVSKFGTKDYEVQAFPEKFGGKHIHMATCLSSLTGSQDVVIMWDAGSCEISEIGSLFGDDRDLGTTKYNIYFINSKENLSDPAPKPTVDTLATKNKNVNIYFLEEADPTSTTIYPVWPGNGKDQNAHVYSGYNMITKKGEGKVVSATLISKTGLVVPVEDIKESSKVSNAVSNAVLSMITKNNPDDAMAYFFLKRAGDWCQALTLLDKSRKYKITAAKGTTDAPYSSETTLAELEARNAKIVLITNDRVLLAYSISLGLNVMFTNVRNAANWLVYFRNRESGKVDDVDEVLALSKSNKVQVDAFIPHLIDVIRSLQMLISKNLSVLTSVDISNFTSAIATIRDATFRLARLPGVSDMESIQLILSTAESDIAQTRADQRLLVNVLSRLRSANNNLTSAIDVSSALLSSADPVYPDYAKEKSSLDALIAKVLAKEVITSTSDVYVQYQTIVDKLFSDRNKTSLIVLSALPDDATVRSAAAARGIQLGETRVSRTSAGFSSIGFLYEYFNKGLAPQKGGGVLYGGAGGPIQTHFESTYLAWPLRNAKNVLQYSTETTDSAYELDRTEFIAKDGNFIVDIFGKHTSVVDGFITDDINVDLATRMLADSVVPNIPSDPDSIYPFLYIVFKTLLSQIDNWYNELLGLKSLEYSNLEALIRLSEARNDIQLLDRSVSVFYENAGANQEFTLPAISASVESFSQWVGAELRKDNPDEMINNYYSRINAIDQQGRQPNLALIESEYRRENSTEDQAIFIEETGPQLLYLADVDKEIGKLLTNRDVLIEMFSFPIVSSTKSTLLAYSKSIQDPAYVLRVTGSETPAAKIEEAIEEAAKPSGPQAAGVRMRRPLYSKVVQPKTRRARKSKTRRSTA